MKEFVTYPMAKVIAAGLPTNLAIKSSSSVCNLVVPDRFGSKIHKILIRVLAKKKKIRISWFSYIC